MNRDQGLDARSIMVWRLRRMAAIALITAILTALGLLVAIHLLTDPTTGLSYREIFHAHAVKRAHLLPVLLIAGLILTTATGILTWLIALYSTFRVAGPLHRFSLNLDRQIHAGPLPLESFREGDLLRTEHLHFSGALNRLQYHYDLLNERIDHALIAAKDPDPQIWHASLERLKSHERQVRL
ncbi:MAG: hypothetical protein HQL91_13090 [Magnetococcales bacterium]|nr:hypothetical protein [Magnetococcales bacterium]